MDFALLFLRLLVMLVFVWSGWSHATKSEERAKDIGFSPAFTKLLGTVELLAGLGVGFGVLPHLSSAGLMIVMLGAMHRKADSANKQPSLIDGDISTRKKVQPHFTFAHVSFSVTVRLNTSLSRVESGSTQKYPRRSNW